MGGEMGTISDPSFDATDPIVGVFAHASLAPSPDSKVPQFTRVPITKVFITDPPYNIGFKYGPGVDDSLTEDEYATLLGDTVQRCSEAADEDAHLFIIHYPESLARHWDVLTGGDWEFRQWLTWTYPTNTGHSKNHWTTAHRAILWLTKGNPHFNARAVTQQFKNPSVKVVKEKVAEGIHGVALYDWWEIPQVKNISHDYKGYENQIPFELLRRIILCASQPGDWVGDPFAGTFSTARAALNLGRRGWGCDLNPDVKKFWPTTEEWNPREEDPGEGNVDQSEFDVALEHIPRDQLDRALLRLLKRASESELKEAIGRVNGPRIYHELKTRSESDPK
jgi:DNA modification methylase